MDPLFSIDLVSGSDWMAIGTQAFSAACVLIAAIYAGSYPKRKDKVEHINKSKFVLGKLMILSEKLLFFIIQLDKIFEAENDDELQIDVETYRTTAVVFGLQEDVSFLLNNEETISSLIKKQINIASFILDYQLCLAMVDKELTSQDSLYLWNYLKDLRKRFEKLGDNLDGILDSIIETRKSLEKPPRIYKIHVKKPLEWNRTDSWKAYKKAKSAANDKKETDTN